MTTEKTKNGCLMIGQRYFATKKEYVAFAEAVKFYGTLTGSRAFAEPAVTGMSDADYLLMCSDYHALCDEYMIHPMEERAKQMYAGEQYDRHGSVQCVYVLPPNGTFAEINILVCRTTEAFREWALATEICQEVSKLSPNVLKEKEVRVAFFEKIRAIFREARKCV